MASRSLFSKFFVKVSPRTSGFRRQPKLPFLSRSLTEDLGLSSNLESPSDETLQTRLLKVAIVGRPNAGKSTLINRIMNLNVCDVSEKTHTTRFPLQAAFISGNTQIVFVDTPGIAFKPEIKKFKLNDKFKDWRKIYFKDIDIVGVICDSNLLCYPRKFRHSILFILSGIPESIPAFLIMNKIDLVKRKSDLLNATKGLVTSEESEKLEESEEWESDEENKRKFTMVFYISALKNDGVQDLTDYLLLQAKPSGWLLPPDKVFNVPLNVLIENLIRAKMFNLLEHEAPYQCKYTVEYLEENDRNELQCVLLVTCMTVRHYGIILGKRKYLKEIAETVQSDLFHILGKVIRIRLVVVTNAKAKYKLKNALEKYHASLLKPGTDSKTEEEGIKRPKTSDQNLL